jgi:hypothetical protein
MAQRPKAQGNANFYIPEGPYGLHYHGFTFYIFYRLDKISAISPISVPILLALLKDANTMIISALSLRTKHDRIVH